MTKIAYSDMLDKIFSNYEGRDAEHYRHIPSFFKLLQKIYLTKDLTWEIKFKINACLSYFAIREDVIPDKIYGKGYLDDLFICAYVLNEILEKDAKLVIRNWKQEGDIDVLIKDTLNFSREALQDKVLPVLRQVGLLKFGDVCKYEGHMFDSPDFETKKERLDGNKLDLMALLRSIFTIGGSKPEGRELRYVKKLFDHRQWDDVIKILERVEVYESGYDKTHEIKVDEIRRKVLLDIDEELLDG